MVKISVMEYVHCTDVIIECSRYEQGEKNQWFFSPWYKRKKNYIDLKSYEKIMHIFLEFYCYLRNEIFGAWNSTRIETINY